MLSGVSDEVTGDQLVKQAIAALRQNDTSTAQRLLAQAVATTPDNEQAWLWLSGSVRAVSERRYCLERVLTINPQNTMASQALAALPPGESTTPDLQAMQAQPARQEHAIHAAAASRLGESQAQQPFAPVQLTPVPGATPKQAPLAERVPKLKREKKLQIEQKTEPEPAPREKNQGRPARDPSATAGSVSAPAPTSAQAASAIPDIPLSEPLPQRIRRVISTPIARIALLGGVLVVALALVGVFAGPQLLASFDAGESTQTANLTEAPAAVSQASTPTLPPTSAADATPDVEPGETTPLTPTLTNEAAAEAAETETAEAAETEEPEEEETPTPTAETEEPEEETPTPTAETEEPEEEAEEIVVGYVINGGNMRSEPRVAPDTVIGQICPGDQVAILEEQAGWLHFRLTTPAAECHPDHVARSTEGWASATLLEQSSFQPPPSYPAMPEKLTVAVVTAISQGDTVTIAFQGNSVSMRLAGIDAPDTGECFANQATERARELLTQGFVMLEPTTDLEERDDEGFLQGYLWIPDGRLVNLDLIDEGYVTLSDDLSSAYDDAFEQADLNARTKERGLWAPGACNDEQ
jgi:endonuclease YncB( thermonuclease family)